jgi:hypothetical protein
MSRLIHRLNWKAHSKLEKSLGYPLTNDGSLGIGNPNSTKPCIQMENSLELPIISLANLSQPSSINADLTDYPLAQTDDYWLLLDRKTRALYVGEGKLIQGLLENPESLGLLATLDQNSNPIQDTHYAAQNQLSKLSRWTTQRQWLKLIPIGIGAALIASLGLTLLKSNQPSQVASTPSQTLPVIPGGSCGHKRFRDGFYILYCFRFRARIAFN